MKKNYKQSVFVGISALIVFLILLLIIPFTFDATGKQVLNARANFTINADPATDFFAPSITIINPTGTFNNQTVNITVVFSDNQVLDSCWYNITTSSGVLEGPAFNRLNCTGSQGTFTVSQNLSYIFYAFANDTANNRNSSNSNFTINGTQPVAVNVTVVDEEGFGGIELFVIKPTSFKFRLQEKETILSRLNIRSLSNFNLKVSVSLEGVEDFITLKEREFTIAPKANKDLEFYVEAKKLGVFAGKINVLGGRTLKEAPVIIEIESKERNFDVKVNLKDESRIIDNNEDPTALVKIHNLKKEPRYAEVYYTIKDFKGNIIVQERENNVFVDEINESYKTLKLPSGISDGNYIFIVQVVDASSMAADSDFFIVAKNKLVFEAPLEIVIPKTSTLIFFFIVLLLIIITHYRFLAKNSKKKTKSSDLKP